MSKKKEQGEDTVLPEGGNPGGAPVDASDTVPGGTAGEPARAVPDAEVADLRDRLLRTQAEFDNYRKRMVREREESARHANAALLSDLLAVIDDFERAIRSAEESRDFGVFLEGVSMIERRMLEMLESRWGLKRFSSVGEAFDPVRHEAMMRTEAPAAPGAAPAGPIVAEEFQRGYYLHERVLRPAKVRVQMPAERHGPAADDAGAGPAQG
ncbi:MAG: nucleotide exchange factor GrpE [Spirochaetes bacterium]|nr:nucleotide exchange factor GrpE [Spirochaetota bacterium]